MSTTIVCTPLTLPENKTTYFDHPVLWLADGYNMKFKDAFLSRVEMGLGYKPHHLYLVANEPPKKDSDAGYYVLYENTIYENASILNNYSGDTHTFIAKVGEKHGKHVELKEVRAIVATTNDQLSLACLISSKWVETVWLPTHEQIKQVLVSSEPYEYSDEDRIHHKEARILNVYDAYEVWLKKEIDRTDRSLHRPDNHPNTTMALQNYLEAMEIALECYQMFKRGESL